MTGIIIILVLAGGTGFLIINNREEIPANEKLINLIDAQLPQTQCGKCGYPGCRPYAVAIARKEADINQCPPGGAAIIKILARMLNRPFKPLNPKYGIEKPVQVAFIDEDECIGCVKCIRVCPVDAIIGAPKQMHTIIGEVCTGCELCIEPCPVDCIRMLTNEEARHLQSIKEGLPPVLTGQAGKTSAPINQQQTPG